MNINIVFRYECSLSVIIGRLFFIFISYDFFVKNADYYLFICGYNGIIK